MKRSNGGKTIQDEEAIFHAASQLADPAKRQAFLDLACEGDAELRGRIETLLTSADDTFFDRPMAGLVTDKAVLGMQEASKLEASTPGPSPQGPGSQVGRYKLLQKLGEGGCGVVYMAEQTEPVRRRVALKVIKIGMDTGQLIARFEAERQALALMDHPNIAKVLDAGATETGRPFFVMELVRGTKITQYCDENNASTDQRLQLFIQVCQAIQHAHQKGIIHRDIKPSNILVTINDGVPVPKVIDFGIAKATTGQQLTDKTLFTAYEQFVGTPAYMSPEQTVMTSLDIDTRSDIYSLGVLLYELLTGKTPFDPQELLSAGFDEMRRTIREREPARPSTRLSTMVAAELATLAKHRQAEAPKLINLLRGDLDWIVMKALEKDRARRYDSAHGLAMDLRRFLTNEAVLARPPSRVYQLQKLVRRHKLSVIATTAVALSLVLGMGLSTWMFLKERQAYRRAVHNESQAHQAQDRENQLRRMAQAQTYTADLNLVQQAWDQDNYPHAHALLRKHIPGPGEPDLRGFEWRYLWKLCQDESLFTIRKDPGGRISLVASSPGHPFVAVGGPKLLRLLDPLSGREVDRLKLPGTNTDGWMKIACASKAPDIVAAALGGGVAEVWDLRRKVRLAHFRPHEEQSIGALALSPDGLALATSEASPLEGNIKLWDLGKISGEVPPARWTNHFTTACAALAFSPDGNSLVSAGKGLGMAAWNPEDGKELKPFREGTSLVFCIAFSPDGRWLADAGRDSRIEVWDVRARRVHALLSGHKGGVRSLAFSPDSRQLASGGEDNTIRVWDWNAQRQLAVLRGHTDDPISVAFAPDGSRIFSANGDELKVWEPKSRPPAETIETQQNWAWVAISPNLKWLVVKSYSTTNTTQVWDLASRQHRFDLPTLADGVHEPVFSPDSRWFALGSDDRQVRIWDTSLWLTPTNSPAPQRVLPHSFATSFLAFSPDQKLLAVTGPVWYPHESSLARSRLVFWQVGTWNQLDLLTQAGVGPTKHSSATRLAFAPDARTLAIGYEDGAVRLWDIPEQRLLAEWNYYGPGNYTGVLFSNSGRWLLTDQGNRPVVLYDIAHREQPRQISSWDCEHRGGVWTTAFDPDDRTIATSGTDGTIKFWNVLTHEPALTLRHSEGPGLMITFAPGGNLLASADANGVVKLWSASPLAECTPTFSDREEQK